MMPKSPISTGLRGAVVGLAGATMVAGASFADNARANQLSFGPQISSQSFSTPKHLTLLGIMNATTAPHGLGYAAIAFTNQREDVGDDWDGSAAVGLGFGDAVSSVGAELTMHITSLDNKFGDSGFFSAKLSRQIRPGPSPIFIGLEVDHLGNWGDAEDIDPTGRLALTMLTQLPTATDSYPVMLTIGATTNRNATSGDVVFDDDDKEPGIFFGAGIGLTENIGASASWTGETVELGTSLRITDNTRFTTTLNDVFDQEDRRGVTFGFSIFTSDLY